MLHHDLILGMIKDRTKDNPILSAEITAALQITDGESRPLTRALILETIKLHKVAIGANSKGYYMINTKAELIEYAKHLAGRARKITRRADLIIRNFNRGEKK